MTIKEYSDFLKVGFIQTNVNSKKAWGENNTLTLHMKDDAECAVWAQIKLGFHKIYNHHAKPNIIIMPEVTLPHCYIKKVCQLAARINSVVIAGLDYIIDSNRICNKSILIVPNNWGTPFKSYNASIYVLGKKNPAYLEKQNIEAYNKNHFSNLEFVPDNNIYLIDADKFGKIGFAICSDFYDLERFIAYKGRVQHVIIIAFNKDTNSFFALAEAISRLVMCNVVICNSGNYGDSMAFCPFRENYFRQKFRHQGANLFATQVVELPVKELIKDQLEASKKNGKVMKFKCPPDYKLINL